MCRTGRRPHKGLLIVIVVALVLLAGSVALRVTMVPACSSSSASDAATTVEQRASLNDYSWDELSRLSSMIAAADGDDGALQVERDYNLVDSSGHLTGATKDFTLSDGTAVSVQIAGFRHDTRSDGSGMAGITFIFTDCIASRPMCTRADNAGGWRSSAMRAYLNSGMLEELPSDLREEIAAVDKRTNNVGETDDVSLVSTTSDKLWLFSFVEVTGDVDSWWETGRQPYADVLDAEGTQYQLFSEAGVACSSGNAESAMGYGVLVKSFDGQACWWWERSADDDDSSRFNGINGEGEPNVHGDDADDATGVVPGFCL